MSGDLSPDVRGCYNQIADYNGFPAYQIVGGGWYLWATALQVNRITTTLGTDGTAWWLGDAGDPFGEYEPQGTATGDATFAAV